MQLSLLDLRETFAQPAVLSRAEVIAMVGVGGLKRALDHDVLVRMSQGFYAPREHSRSWWTGCAAAVAARGPRAAVAGRSAMFLWGIDNSMPRRQDVVLPASASTRRHFDEVRIVRTRIDYQVYRVNGLNVLEPELALFQAVHGLSEDKARALAITALASRVTRLTRVRELLRFHTRLPGHRRVAQALALVEDGVHSPLEFDASRTILTGRLKNSFVRQYDLLVGPHRYRLDAFDREAMLAVEFDGLEYHAQTERLAADRERDVWLATRGIQVLRFLTTDVRGRPQWCRQRIEDVRTLRLGRVRIAS